MNSEFNGRPEAPSASEAQFWRSMEELLQGGDIEGIMKYAGPLLTHLNIADSFDHRASSGLRYIATACVFAWEERARESSTHHLEQIRQYVAKHAGPPT